MIGSTALASQVMAYGPRFPIVPEIMADELPREGLHQIPAYARQSLIQQPCGQLPERG